MHTASGSLPRQAQVCGKRTLCSRKKHLSDAVSGIPLQIFHQLPGSDALRAACIPDETDLTFRDRFDQTDGKHFTARNRFGGERFRVEADGMRKFQGYVEGGTMEIRGTSKVNSNSDGNLGGSICLYVPEGYYFENTSLDLGAGSLSVEELQTGALEANVGAGKMTFEKLEADQAELDCGAGQMTVEELSSRVAEVSVGMGSVRLNGDVTERLDGECSMGELKLTLAGTQTDFNYDLSCGMGELKVGDDSYNGLAQEKQINNNASKNMELECAMGSVVVEFK